MELKASASFFFFIFLLFLFQCQLSISSTSVHDLLPSGPISSSSRVAAFRQRSGVCRDHGCEVVRAEDAEFQLDTEINRRLLGGSSGYSYKSFNPEKPVCHKPDGKPYNCLPPPSNKRTPRVCGYYRCPQSSPAAG